MNHLDRKIKSKLAHINKNNKRQKQNVDMGPGADPIKNVLE